MDFEKGDVTVGAFVLAALLIFVVTLTAINRERLTAQVYHVDIHLPNIAGIDKGVDVIYRGYKAGAVDHVTIAYKPEFRFVVQLAIKKEITLREGTAVEVLSQGFGGSKVLELLPPPEGEKETSRVIKDGDHLPVIVEMDLMAKANMVMGEVQKFVGDFQKKGTGTQIMNTVQHAQGAVENLDRALANLNALLSENRAALKQSLDNTSGIMTRTNELLAKKDEALQQSLDNLNKSMAHMPAIMANLEAMTADLKRRPWRLIRKGDPNDAPLPAPPAPSK